MALTVEQEKELQRLHQDLDLSENQIQSGSIELTKPDTLSKLVTGGKKPDYNSFSDDELRDMYDRVARPSAMNKLWDGFNDQNIQVGKAHASSSIAISDRGIQTIDLDRETMIKDLDAVMEHYNYDIEPLAIAEAQNLTANARSAEIDGRILNVALSLEKMEETAGQEIPELQEIKERMGPLKQQAKTFNSLTERKIADNVQGALKTKFNQFAQNGGASADQMKELMDSARNKLDPTNMSGGNKHMKNMEKQEIDLSGMNLNGADLSKTDLTGFKVNPQTLAQAKNFEKVKGVDQGTMNIAKEFGNIQKLEAQLDKLKSPSLWDKIKAIPQGGVEKAREKLIAKIDEAKLQVTQKMDPAMFNTQQEQNKVSVEKLSSERGLNAGQKLEHMKATTKLDELNADLIKDESLKSSNLPGLSNEERESILKEKGVAQGDIELNSPGAQKYDQLDSEVKALEKNISVREKLGGSVGQKYEALKQVIKVN